MLPLLVCAAAFLALANAYSIPDPEFQVLKPSGLKVSIPNEDGIQVFSFHGNVNQEMKGLESGQISQDAAAIQNGKFTIYDENVSLQDGDVINYWLYIVHKGLSYHLDNGKFVYQESNIKNRECPPGYKKKVLVADRDAPQIDEITTSSSSDYDEITGSDGLNNYHRNYQHGFRPNIYYGRPWYPFYRRGHWHHLNGPRRGRGHNRWHRRNHNYHYNRFDLNDAPILQGDIGIPEGEHILTIVKRHADSEEEEEDKSESSDLQLESRFGGFSRGFGGANFIYPFKPTHKPYRVHDQRFHGHGYGHNTRRDYDHGYGFYPGHHRPHGPPHRPYPHPGFGKDHHKFDDYYDCEEDNSNENEKPSEPANLETTTPIAKPITKAPEVPSTEEPLITSPTTSTTTTTTTTTTTERTSTFPQIDIRFGES